MPPDLSPAAWAGALSEAATVPAVVDFVQSVLRARGELHSAPVARWEPREIRSREDIEHWHRRIRSLPPAGQAARSPAALGELMRLALDRMDEIGPRRAR